MDDIERLESEVSELGEFRNRFHTSDTKAKVLEQLLNQSWSFDILSKGCTALGGITVGYALAGPEPNWFLAGVGVLIVGVGIGAMIFKSRRVL